jgi:hypothetical protein
VSASTVSRPTENAAIGRCSAPKVPPVHRLLELRAQARRRLDRAYVHLLNGALARAVQAEAVR